MPKELGSITQQGGNVTAPILNVADSTVGTVAALIETANTTNPSSGFARGVVGGTSASATWDVRGHNGNIPVLTAKAPVKSYTITNRSRSSNVATVTLSGTHGFVATEQVQVSGVSDATFNTSSATIVSVTTTTISYANSGSDVASTASSGTAAVVMTADLQRWVNASNVTQASIDNTGVITANGSGLTNLNATNLSSGTVNAARMPALTGDVTTTAGTVATTIANNAVSNAKFRQSSGLSVVGNAATGTANVADITAGVTGGVFQSNGSALSFALVGAGNLSNNAVTDAKLRQGSALSVIGNSTNATANVADIAASADGQVLRRSGTALGFGTVATAGLTDNAVTDLKLRQGAGCSVIGRAGNTTGNVADITSTADFQVLCRNGTAIGFGPINLASSAAVMGILPSANMTGATDTVAGALPTADASVMEGAASTVHAVVPGRQQRHPGHPKAWAYITVSGTTPSLVAGYGVGTPSYGGSTGSYVVPWTTAFSTANYCVQVTCGHKAGSGNVIANVNGLSTTQVSLIFTINSTTVTDPLSFHIVAFGDQ